MNEKTTQILDLVKGLTILELADLVYLCEEKFNVVIDDEDLHNFITVGDVVRYLEEKAKYAWSNMTAKLFDVADKSR